MGHETVTYLTNIVICAIIAALMTHHWYRNGRPSDVRYWMLSAWVMTVADILFAARPILPNWIDRTLPTLLVTVGHGLLFLSAQKTAKLRLQGATVIAVVAFHAVGLALFLGPLPAGDWRKVFNSLIWAGLAFASYGGLKRAPAMFSNSLVAPATFFALHGFFHLLRAAFATLFTVENWPQADKALQMIGDLEVSLFMVALYVGLLVADLQKRNLELSGALAQVKTLSGLLPICSWCKKVRDDDGYWTKVEDYFREHGQIEFTHGICTDCAQEHFRRDQPPPAPSQGGPTASPPAANHR